MKRYVVAQTESLTPDHIIDLITTKLNEYGLTNSIYSIDCDENYSGNYYVEVSLKPYRKKIKKTLITSKLDNYIDKLCDSIKSYLEEGETTPKDDAYVILVSVDGLELGYVSGVTTGRGQKWAYLVSDPNHAKRYNKKNSGRVEFVDEFMIPNYVSTDFKALHVVEHGSDTKELYSWVNEHRNGETYHCYTLGDLVNYEYVKLNDARSLSPISSDDFERILIGYGV